jgi:CDP-6-deoxy-D-xylo-4-hexulose-3-dehydrase
MDTKQILNKISNQTRAVFLTHVQGFNGLTNELIEGLKKTGVHLIEDVCESHGAEHKHHKLGSYGWISNFSFYYAHHMSTIEGGMVCTSCNETYQNLRMLRSHGMLREVNDEKYKFQEIKKHKFLNKDFIFKLAGYNFRNNEIGALIGINQLKKLDENIKKRNSNHQYFLSLLNNDYFYTEFDLKGSSNYAFNLVLKNKDRNLMSRLIKKLKDNKIEFRVGSAGGGNQLRQPYLKKFIKNISLSNFKNTEHIHFYAMYIGNYPSLSKKNISKIVKVINSSIFV